MLKVNYIKKGIYVLFELFMKKIIEKKNMIFHLN